MTQKASFKSTPIRVSPGRERPKKLENGCVLTIGAFDGVHLGHQHIIKQLRSHGERLGLPSAVMTFRPDPAEFFSKQASPALMNWREKMLGLMNQGIDLPLCLPFNSTVRSMTADEFVAEFLVRQLGVRFLMIGDDFRFGVGREGNHDLLVKLGAQYGFDVEKSNTHKLQGQRISSTSIRQCLASGDLLQAEQLLGKPYEICGKVVSGKRLGRELGFPTANIPLKRSDVALKGVFAVLAELPGGQRIQAVANLGVRPAVNSLEQPLLEVHLLDFQPEQYGYADLYGQRLRVVFVKHIREERDFAGLNELKVAITSDVAKARAWFDRP